MAEVLVVLLTMVLQEQVVNLLDQQELQERIYQMLYLA